MAMAEENANLLCAIVCRDWFKEAVNPGEFKGVLKMTIAWCNADLLSEIVKSD